MYNELVKKVSEAENPFRAMGGDELQSVEAQQRAKREAEIQKARASIGKDKEKMWYLLRTVLVERDVDGFDTDSLWNIFMDGTVGWKDISDAEVKVNIEEIYRDYVESDDPDEPEYQEDIPFEEKALIVIIKTKPNGWNR